MLALHTDARWFYHKREKGHSGEASRVLQGFEIRIGGVISTSIFSCMTKLENQPAS
jgi:hypothetical protein